MIITAFLFLLFVLKFDDFLKGIKKIVIVFQNQIFFTLPHAAFFSASSCISWLIQYQTKLKQNVLTQEEINDGWTSDNRTELGYSYYLVAFSTCLFIFNIFIIFVAIRRPSLKNKSRTLADKNPEGVIMLY